MDRAAVEVLTAQALTEIKGDDVEMKWYASLVLIFN
jgi:hypothetical protein